MTANARRNREAERLGVVENVSWLNAVREVRHPIDLTHPIVVRQINRKTGLPVPHPSVPFPERHPYCELGLDFEGRVLQLVGTEKAEITPGNMLLMGPGTPHYASVLSYPQRSVTIHFLPVLLFEMGPNSDGARALARFTTPQKIGSRVIRPPRELTKKLAPKFKQMATEFENRRIGSEFNLRALLMEILTELLRWEESAGFVLSNKVAASNWLQIEKALRYLHEHYAEQVYVTQVARVVGLSVSRLQINFKEALGMSCVHYLRALRISHAKALLFTPNARVTEVALKVGFETLSHFNTSFRILIGMSPTEYVQANQRKKV